MKEDIKISVEEGVKVLEIRTGDLLKQREVRVVNISGDIYTPLYVLQKPMDGLDIKNSHLLVNEEKGVLCLRLDENSDFGHEYVGEMELSDDFTRFGINTGKSYTTFQLADLFKMNRVLFQKKEDAMKLVTELRQFQAKVSQDIERADDARGNTKIKKIQAVESNIPASFVLNLRIFKGQPVEPIEVEIAIDADDLSCRLVSPDANDFQHRTKEFMIGNVVGQVREVAPELRIFYV